MYINRSMLNSLLAMIRVFSVVLGFYIHTSFRFLDTSDLTSEQPRSSIPQVNYLLDLR